MRDKISACVTAGNEERNIRRCLESLRWCDETVVVDSFSRDATVAIAREFTDRVYQHEWLGYIGQKNLVRQMARHPWVLILDADEELSPGLREEIETALERDAGRFVGYQFPRRVYYLGRWIRHGEWYPDVKLRLFRRDRGHTEGREPHDHVVVDGAVRTLRHAIHHYTYDDIRDHIDTVNRFSTITAQQKFSEGLRCRWFDLVLRPAGRFLKAYLLKLGCLDGRRGLLIATISAFGVVVKYAKLWELQLRAPGAEGGPADAG
jgi:glycosyltransferase involved in cell wall biosynthesis